MIALLWILVVLFVGGGIALIFWSLYNYDQKKAQSTPSRRSDSSMYYDEERRSRPVEPKVEEPKVEIKKPRLGLYIAMIIVGFFLFLILVSGGAVQISPTSIGVVENSVTGQFQTLNAGVHIWPFDKKVTPFVTQIYKYDLRRQIIEIGKEPSNDINNGIEASSGSPGNPLVYFWARGWAYPNPDKIIELHRKYGSDYMNSWVDKNWVNIIKAVQGRHEYNYVSNNRVDMETSIEENLQEQLLGDDGQPLVYISQLAITNFSFDVKTSDYMDKVAEMQFQSQQAAQQIEINKNQQEAKKIEAETNYQVTLKNAQAEAAKLEAEAQGQADAIKLKADADAHATKVNYEAQSTGIKQIQEVLANSPEGYLKYLLYSQWDGKMPVWMTSGSELPLIQLPK